MLKESASVDWSSKIELAVHTGNVGSAYRKRLAEEARRSPNEILVNELYAPHRSHAPGRATAMPAAHRGVT